MRFWYFLIIFLLGLKTVCAQVKFDVKLSDRHKQKVEDAKGAKQKLADFRKFYSKDSLKASKAAWRKFKKDHRDSLKMVGLWKEAKANRYKILTNQWGTYWDRLEQSSFDSLKLPKPKDSLDWALYELVKQGGREYLQELYSVYAQYDSTYLEQFALDSVQLDSMELLQRFKLKERIEAYLPEELSQETDLSTTRQLYAGGLDETGQLKKVDKSGVKEFFENISLEEFSKSQLSLAAAKKKYAELPGLTREEEGIKRKSLEGTPFKNRWFLSGNVLVQSTDPIILDTDLKLGYRFNRKLEGGVGLIWREQFKGNSTLTGDGHGYATFASYQVINAYFVYAEWQAIRNQPLFQESDKPTRWEQAHLLGVGRQLSFSQKISATFSLLYDFNYKNNNLNGRPLIFRFGYRIGF